MNFVKVHSKDRTSKYRAEIITNRNDSRINRHQRVQLQGWRGNCDVSVVLDYNSCLEYLTKYASKPEKLSSVAKDAFTHPPKLALIILILQVGLRDMSIQEICHQLIKLKLHSSSFQVITLS